MDIVTEIIHETQAFWDWIIGFSDPRVKHWGLMETPWATIALTVLYLISIQCGKMIMKSYQAFELRWPLFLYNVILIWINWNIFSELVLASWALNYNYLCQPIIYSQDPNELRVARALWWYYMSKLIEFADTAFFVLRKKNNQISFLHVYHHATMFPLWWIGVKWMAGGLACFGPIINSFIHVVMYSYYGLSALGPAVQKYLWWKKYLTKLQLLQFIVGMIWASQLIVFGCPHVPSWMIYATLLYGLSMITLFMNFYYRSYVQRASPHSRDLKMKNE